jgi:hypothetical protein
VSTVQQTLKALRSKHDLLAYVDDLDSDVKAVIVLQAGDDFTYRGLGNVKIYEAIGLLRAAIVEIEALLQHPSRATENDEP